MYEAASEITTVGAGISVWKRTWTILKDLGLDIELAKKAIEPPVDAPKPGLTFRRSDQPEPGYNFYQMMNPYGAITLHRVDVVDVLRAKIPKSYPIYTSKRLQSYSRQPDGSITMHFADGSSAVTDILIGADGIRSPTRQSLFRAMAADDGVTDPAKLQAIDKETGPVWTGTLAYRSLIPAEKLESLYPGHQACRIGMAYLGKNKHIVAYPISQGRLINCVPFSTVVGGEGTTFNGKWVADVSTQEVIDCFSNFEEEAQALTKCMEDPTRWAIHAMTPLPHYASGRVAIIGDAAHAMATHLGAGAGQAIEDVYILGRLLAHPSATLDKAPDILRIYERVRLPFASGVAAECAATGYLYEFNGPAYGGAECEGLRELGKQIEKQWEWHWTKDFREDWRRAETLLSEALG
ncbi:FAD/NAD(P)-binding domain-containing protein [Neolentinus lepideus HHB14362 ss-1]|uniref:FAD/NAD(P)-binding domain-containing protein n=1 Tax=Neolentinus lepideus HHB14362 ss-1 TaxID=1314782 RepID=A0A165SKJ2_9AGAM|nr:FAD/NAD(P)-binding domain-containing protein [Neolentinus lepideus HHB14362 ss-1]